jgi:uncharacterized membrane protein
MNSRTIRQITLLLIIFSFLYGAYLYPQMPDRIASHWDARGQVDGYMPKAAGLFLIPAISLILFAVLISVPRLDPLRKNIESFRQSYDLFALEAIAFLIYIQLLTVLWNQGLRFNIVQLLSPALGLLFYFAGVLTQSSRQNWFVGIRTPWTMSSESVWDKVNRRAGKLFKVSGALAALGAVFPRHALILIMAPVVSTAAYSIAYSYLEYKRESGQSSQSVDR